MVPVEPKARETIADLKAQIAAIDTQLGDAQLAAAAAYPDELTMAVFKVTRGFAGTNSETYFQVGTSRADSMSSCSRSSVSPGGTGLALPIGI